MLPAAIVFDFDGTMVDTETAVYEAVRRTYADFGLDLPPDAWMQAAGTMWGAHWVDELVHATAGAVDAHEARRRNRVHAAEIDDLTELRPGVQGLLDDARAHGIPMAIASNSASDWIEYHLDRLCIRDHFASLATIDRVERGKPFPDPYLLACRELAAEPTSSVAFEDSEAGTQSAAAAGMFVIAAPGPMTLGHDLRAAHLVIDGFEDFAFADLAHVAFPHGSGAHPHRLGDEARRG